jgi:hypothetical protein
MHSPGDSSGTQRSSSRCAKRGCILLLCIIAVLAVAGYLDLYFRMRSGVNSNTWSTCYSILNALEQYEMDYDSYPVPSSVSKDTDLLSDSHSGIIAALKGMNVAVNPRKKDYLGDLKEARLVDGKPVGGLWRGKGNSIGIYDPWGRPYFIRLDTDGDGHVEDPSRPGSRLKTFALIWSAGKDGDASSWSDNIGTREFAR